MPPPDLQRKIGLRAFTLAILNTTVGTGIFVLPALVAANLGSASILAYLVCGALIFLIALCFAEVGSKITVTGGTYAYIETAFGPLAGFIASNIFWFGSCIISDAAVANALVSTLKYFFHFLDIEIYKIIFLFGIFAVLAFINIRSVKYGVRFVEMVTFAKLLPLLILVFAAARFVSIDNLKWTSIPSLANIGTTSLLLFYAFLGVETPVTNSGEIKNPQRNIPLGIFLGIGAVLVLYIAIQLVTQGVLGQAISTQKDSPLSTVAGIVFGKWGLIILIVVTAVSMLGNLAGEVLSIPRILYAGARDGIMPKPLARVHPRYLTPHWAVAVYASLGFIISLFAGFQKLAILASAATLLIYLGVVLSVIKLRRKEDHTSPKTFRIPAGILVPVLATVIIGWLLFQLKGEEMQGITIFILALAAIYFLIKWVKKDLHKRH